MEKHTGGSTPYAVGMVDPGYGLARLGLAKCFGLKDYDRERRAFCVRFILISLD